MGLNLKRRRRWSPRSARRWRRPRRSSLPSTAVWKSEQITELRAKARRAGVYLRVLQEHPGASCRRGYAVRRTGSAHDRARSCTASRPTRWRLPRCCNEFAKTNDKLVIKARRHAEPGDDREGVATLASMPSREELLAKLMGTMQAPIAKFAQHAQRSSGQVRAHPRGGAGRQREGCVAASRARLRNRTFQDSGVTTMALAKAKSLTQSPT